MTKTESKQTLQKSKNTFFIDLKNIFIGVLIGIVISFNMVSIEKERIINILSNGNIKTECVKMPNLPKIEDLK